MNAFDAIDFESVLICDLFWDSPWNSPGSSPGAVPLSSSPLLFDVFADISYIFSILPTIHGKEIACENLSTLTSQKTDSILRDVLPHKNPSGTIGREKPLLSVFSSFESSNVEEIRKGLTNLFGYSESKFLATMTCLAESWDKLPSQAKLLVLHILARINTDCIVEKNDTIDVKINFSENKNCVADYHLEFLLKKLFCSSSPQIDAGVMHDFVWNSTPPIASPFTLVFLRAMPTYPLEVQMTFWDVVVSEYQSIEKESPQSPLYIAYFQAIGSFLAGSLFNSSKALQTAQKVYKFHTLNGKKNISEILISRNTLSKEQIGNLKSLFHSYKPRFDSIESFEAQILFILSPNFQASKFLKLALAFEGAIYLENRKELDRLVFEKIIPLFNLKNHLTDPLIDGIVQLNLPRSAAYILQRTTSRDRQTKLLILYFGYEESRILATTPLLSIENLDLPYEGIRSAILAKFRHMRSIQDLPSFTRLSYLRRIFFCEVTLEIMGYLPFTMKQIDENLLLHNLEEKNLFALKTRVSSMSNRVFIPYAAALLFNKQSLSCIQYVRNLLNTIKDDPLVTHTFEALLVHALVASGNANNEARALYEKVLLYFGSNPDTIHAAPLIRLFFLARPLGKVEMTSNLLQTKLGLTFVPLEAVSWMVFWNQLPSGLDGIEFFHQKALLVSVPNNISFTILKLSLMLHHRKLNAVSCIEAYEKLLPDFGFVYLRARAYLDPSFPEKVEIQKIHDLLEVAFLCNPRYLDISLALFLIHCKHGNVGIKKEEFCGRLIFYADNGLSEVLHFLKPPFEKPGEFADRLEHLIVKDGILPHEILSCFSRVHRKNEIK